MAHLWTTADANAWRKVGELVDAAVSRGHATPAQWGDMRHRADRLARVPFPTGDVSRWRPLAGFLGALSLDADLADVAQLLAGVRDVIMPGASPAPLPPPPANDVASAPPIGPPAQIIPAWWAKD